MHRQHYLSFNVQSLLLILALGIVGWPAMGSAAPADVLKAEPGDLVFIIQPILNEEQTQRAYQPLADYLGKVAGKRVVIRTLPNFVAYWEVMRQSNGYDLVLDAAHFTDYRAKKLGFKVLAKIPDTVSYSLIVGAGALVIDPIELIGKTVATPGAPSVGAARLNAMYPNPVRQPVIVDSGTAEESIQMLLKNKVQAAMAPTPLVSQQMAQGGGISVVTTTEPIPHIALSAAPRLNAELRERIRAALVNAPNTEDGKKMLKGINFERFDPANEQIYAGQGTLLKEYWGY
ncbi:MAG: PhnD/SsuA/transferrin family substrate-binding protein [Gammaproteobacteria bacterium]|nr:PhnD/SsuA/transferrin family substrate-binding protein [Gammaproteobacteria bacterium]